MFAWNSEEGRCFWAQMRQLVQSFSVGFVLLDFLCFRQKRIANEKPTKDSNCLAVSAAPSAGVIRFRFKGSSGRE